MCTTENLTQFFNQKIENLQKQKAVTGKQRAKLFQAVSGRNSWSLLHRSCGNYWVGRSCTICCKDKLFYAINLTFLVFD